MGLKVRIFSRKSMAVGSKTGHDGHSLPCLQRMSVFSTGTFFCLFFVLSLCKKVFSRFFLWSSPQSSDKFKAGSAFLTS